MRISHKLLLLFVDNPRTASSGVSRQQGDVEASGLGMRPFFLIPRHLWQRHEVLKLLGWADDGSRFSAPSNQIMLPVEPIGSVLSGLALSPSPDEKGAGPARFKFARQQLDILLHEYRNRHWSGRQRRFREDRDWLADKLRRMLQFSWMALDRRYSSYVKQRSLTLRDPLNPVVALSAALFSGNVGLAARQMQVLEEEFCHGPQSSYDRVVNLCSGCHGQRDRSQTVDATAAAALRSATSRFPGRISETEEQFSVVFGLESDPYHFSAHAQLVRQIDAWLELASAHPFEVCRIAVEEQSSLLQDKFSSCSPGTCH